mmetsp:Transcript_3348/g.4101  ORF Transcript_3348/g.4101 Transcript_3348/m.4101 type:complete len:147 (+) Transcript_3348:348-788(+)
MKVGLDVGDILGASGSQSNTSYKQNSQTGQPSGQFCLPHSIWPLSTNLWASVHWQFTRSPLPVSSQDSTMSKNHVFEYDPQLLKSNGSREGLLDGYNDGNNVGDNDDDGTLVAITVGEELVCVDGSNVGLMVGIEEKNVDGKAEGS